MSHTQWGHGNVYQRGRIWWVRYPLNGATIKESSKSEDRGVAEKLLKTRLAQSHMGDLTSIHMERITVGELLDGIVRDYKINGKSLAWVKIVVAHLRPHFGYFKAARVGSAHVEAYIDARRDQGISNATINRELAILRRAFYLAYNADPPKIRRVPRIEKLAEDNVRAGFMEQDVFDAIVANLPAEIVGPATFAYYTGCRRTEILGLRWPQVDLVGRVVRLNAGETKNKQGRILPLGEELAALIGRIKAERDEYWPESEWVFSRGGAQIRDFRRAWKKAVSGIGHPELLFHDFRRTGVRNLIRAGAPEKVAMAITGHKTRSVFDRYHIVPESDLHEAMSKVEKHLKKTTKKSGTKVEQKRKKGD